MEESGIEVKQGIYRADLAGPRKISGWETLFIVVISAAITGCEYIFAYHNVAYGIIIALVLAMGIYLLLSIARFNEDIVRSAESLALIPLYILFTSSLPWFFLNQQFLLPAVYSCTLVLCLWYIYSNKLSLAQIFGFNRKKMLGQTLLGISVGLVLGTIEYFVLRPAASFPTFEVRYMLRDVVYMIFFVGVGEELLFRGLIQQDLVKCFGWRWGLFGASFLFAIMHLTWRSIPELFFVFFAALVFGGMYLKSKSLVAPIVSHGIGNVILVAVMPYIFGS